MSKKTNDEKIKVSLPSSRQRPCCHRQHGFRFSSPVFLPTKKERLCLLLIGARATGLVCIFSPMGRKLRYRCRRAGNDHAATGSMDLGFRALFFLTNDKREASPPSHRGKGNRTRLHFLPDGEKIKVSLPSSRQRPCCHRQHGFRLSSPVFSYQ